MKGGYLIRTNYIDPQSLSHIYFALTPANALVCEVALYTGLRISDVLSITTKQLRQKSFTITELKTGKKRKIVLPLFLRQKLLAQAGELFAFPGRIPSKPRTRQAVYNDLKRAAKLFRLKGVYSPHSLRKTYAVELYKRTGDLELCRQKLNHDDIETTLIYVLSDVISKRGCANGKSKTRTKKQATNRSG